MKGILAEPGKAPVIASLPDSLWAIENRLGTPCEMIVLPRTPAVLFVGRYDGPIQPASLLNRKYRGRQLYGPILCYGWKGNNIQPMNKDVQTEMLDRLKGRRAFRNARAAPTRGGGNASALTVGFISWSATSSDHPQK